MLPVKPPIYNQIIERSIERIEAVSPLPGFTHLGEMTRVRRLLVGIDGLPDTGKTEFSMTFPPPICVLFVDQGYEHVITKPNPPPSRQRDIDYKIFHLPQAGMNPTGSGTATQKDAQSAYQAIWNDFYSNYIAAVTSPKYKTVVVDGDTETWDLQRLAAFGKLTQVPPLEYTNVNQSRKIMIRRGFDSGKNMAFTYRVGPEYETSIKVNSRGEPKEVSEKTGNWVRKGFADQEYITQVQLRSMRKHTEKGVQFGVEITKCKPDVDLIGMTLWGSDCCYAGLIQTIYPGASLEAWGL